MNPLLHTVLEANGGLDNWRKVTSLDVNVSLKGGLFTLKGYPDGMPNVVMHVDTRKPGLQTSPYPGPGRRGHYTAERVWIEDLEGRVLEERADFHRRLHAQQPTDPWDQLDRLAFVSYAMWEYLTVPFVLADPDFVVEEIASRKEYEEPWRTLRVVFPERIPTHSREQFFYVDEDYLLRRFDFEAVASAAHYCFDYAMFDGLMFPTLHRIIAKQRENSLFKSSTGVLIDVADIRITR